MIDFSNPTDGVPLMMFKDYETTGFPKKWNLPTLPEHKENFPRIVSFAYIICDINGNEIERNEGVFRPEPSNAWDSMTADTIRVHGITATKALEIGGDGKLFMEQITNAIEKVDFIVGHNIGFDIMIFKGESLWRGLDTRLMYRKRKICTQKETTDKMKLKKSGKFGRGTDRYKYPTLMELHKRLFQKEFKGAHGAMPDTDACFRCYWKAVERKWLPHPSTLVK